MINNDEQKIVHIGLMKCGSTHLQTKIFNNIIKIKKLKSNLNNKDLYNIFYKHYLSMLFENSTEYLNLINDVFITSEKLVGYIDPYYWEKYSNLNLIGFGKNTHIVLVIREPRGFLSSVYLEACVHANYLIKPEYFFLNKKSWSSQIITTKFSIENFSYSKLINMYKDKFDRVSVIKFENLFNPDTFVKIFKLNEDEANELKTLITHKKMNDKKTNRGYSKRAVKFIFLIKKCLSFFHLQLTPSNFRQKYIDDVLKQNSNSNINKSKHKHKRKYIIEILSSISKIFNIGPPYMLHLRCFKCPLKCENKIYI